MVDNGDLLFGFFNYLLFLKAGFELAHIFDYRAVHAHIWDCCAGIVGWTALLSRRRPALRGPQISSLRFVQQPLVGLRNRYQRGIVLAYLQICESRKLALCAVLPSSVRSMTTGID